MITLYHGSNVSIEQIDLSLSRKGKDFGCGFYLNANRQQAMDMAIRTTQRMRSGTPTVTAYLFDESILNQSGLNIKIFDDYSVEWAEFVLMNRKNTSETPAHPYDIVIGPISQRHGRRTNTPIHHGVYQYGKTHRRVEIQGQPFGTILLRHS